MFDQYSYFEKSKTFFPEVKAIHRISGLSGLEEVLQNIRNQAQTMLMVEDDDDGYLSFNGGNTDNGFKTFYVVSKAKINDSADRVLKRKECMAIALKLFKKMMSDGQDFGDLCYGFDRSRVDYRKVGPLINNYIGYSFSYIMADENFILG